MGFFDNIVEKLNPAQRFISSEGKVTESSTSPIHSYRSCYEKLEVVNRAVNMLVDDVSAIDIKIGDNLALLNSVSGIKKKTLERILNKEPNPYQDISSFRRALIMDLIIDGNIFLYYDGVGLYHLPADKVTVVSDKKTFVNSYVYDNGSVTYYPDEIIHIKENSYKTVYRGSSRLEPALGTMNLILKMRKFQTNFFDNGAVPGLVLLSENVLNDRLKARLTTEWQNKFKPESGGRRPIILDGGLTVDQISNINFQELDFQNAIKESEVVILKALGIPPLLLDSGNNANLRPNHRLYYLETIIPIINKINSSLSKFFGYDIYEDTTYIEALRPELRDQAAYLQSLVNAGIITRNEARLELGREAMEGHDELVIPQNIAGSAVNPSQGGAPPKGIK